MPEPTGPTWRGRARLAVVLALVGIATINAVAAMHAYRMTHFARSGARTGPVVSLSILERAVVLLTGTTLPRPTGRRTPADAGVPFERVTMVSGDGTSLEAWYVPVDAPHGVVALFHGYGRRSLRSLKRPRLSESSGTPRCSSTFGAAAGRPAT